MPSPLPRMPTHLCAANPDDDSFDAAETSGGCWNPALRQQLGALSALGLLETAYLTYDKLQYAAGGKSASLVGALCSDGGASSCGDVLHGPYASLHVGGADVPLSALGMAAYGAVFALATLPLLSPESSEGGESTVQDGDNRIALLGGTTLMASFSVYLVSLLVGVIHQSCLFCFASAGLSVSMAVLSWTGGMLPNAEGNISRGEGISSEAMDLRKRGLLAGASSVGFATATALGLFLSVGDEGSYDSLAAATTPASSSGTLLASASSAKSFRDNIPPPITTTSSATALTLASDMKSLNSRMFGAFWCSHCYDQKQALGLEAMQFLPYVECDREGYNNQRSLCKERDVPGYPTWEIGGKLFPGERSLEELREIVDDVMAGRSAPLHLHRSDIGQREDICDLVESDGRRRLLQQISAAVSGAVVAPSLASADEGDDQTTIERAETLAKDDAELDAEVAQEKADEKKTIADTQLLIDELEKEISIEESESSTPAEVEKEAEIVKGETEALIKEEEQLKSETQEMISKIETIESEVESLDAGKKEGGDAPTTEKPSEAFVEKLKERVEKQEDLIERLKRQSEKNIDPKTGKFKAMSAQEYRERVKSTDADFTQFLRDTVANEKEWEQDLDAFKGFLDREFGPAVKELSKDLKPLVGEVEKDLGPLVGEMEKELRNEVAPAVGDAMQQLKEKAGLAADGEVEELKQRAGDLIGKIRSIF
ncbi:hypothetical protein ACHAXT_008370 [Thalassiosira profunda]